MNNLHFHASQPKELQMLHNLHPQIELSPQDNQHYNNLLKGYEGEHQFYQILKEKLLTTSIVLYDLLLESNGTLFQIDSLLIFNNTIILCDVKNYDGDFYVDQDKWYVADTDKEIRNPLLQLKRSEFLLRNLFRLAVYNYSVQSYIIFINKEFTLYQAPLNLPVIFPAQTTRFIDKINTQSPIITEKDRQLARQLIKMHHDQPLVDRLPKYTFKQVKKEIICASCSGFLEYYNYNVLVYINCNSKENIEIAVMRNVKEFMLLFPNKKVTTQSIFEWCSIINSKKTIRRILMKHLNLKRKGRYSYFVMKTE